MGQVVCCGWLVGGRAGETDLSTHKPAPSPAARTWTSMWRGFSRYFSANMPPSPKAARASLDARVKLSAISSSAGGVGRSGGWVGFEVRRCEEREEGAPERWTSG